MREATLTAVRHRARRASSVPHWIGEPRGTVGAGARSQANEEDDNDPEQKSHLQRYHVHFFLVSVKGATELFAWGISRKRLEEKAEKELGAEVVVEAPWTPGPLSPTALLKIEPGNEGKTAVLIQVGKNASRMEPLGTIPPGVVLRKGDFGKEGRRRKRTHGVASLARRSAKRRIEGKSQDSEVGRRAAVLALWCHGGSEAAKLMGDDEPRAEVSDEIRRTMKELGRELEMFFFADRTYKR